MSSGTSQVVRLLQRERATVAVFLVLLVAALTVRLATPFEFPVAWNDESFFIGQAYALAKHGTLFVDALHPERPLMWMPPGYFIYLAGVFSLFDYSFDVARWASTVLYLVSVCLALILITQLPLTPWPRRLALAFTLFAFLSPYTLAMSNIARMEALYTMLYLLSLLMMLRGRPGIGLAIVIASATVHYNAVYLLLPYAVLVLWVILRRDQLVLRASELLALLLAFAALATYALLIAGNLSGFIEDMRFQFAWKRMGLPLGGPSGWAILTGVLGIAAWQTWRSGCLGADTILSLHAASFLALQLHGYAMWYQFSAVLGCWLLLLGLLTTFSTPPAARVQRILCGGLIAAVIWPLAAFGYTRTEHFGPLWPRTELVTKHVVAPEEIERVRHWIHSLPPGTRVSFGLSGVQPFFLADMEDAGVVWSTGRYSMTEIFPVREDDYRVVCDSSLFPSYLLQFEWDINPPREGVDSGCRIIELSPSEDSAAASNNNDDNG